MDSPDLRPLHPLPLQKPSAPKQEIAFHLQMETSPLPILSTALLITLYFFFRHLRCRQAHKLPPGPAALPVIGNLHQLGNLPHRRLHSLAKSYGPIMFLRLGNKPTVVVSSPEAAELVLKTYDGIFSSRPSVDALHHLSYGNKGMAFAESGAYWRGMRKLCTLQLLSPAKVESFAPMRREELGRVVRRVRAAAAAAHEAVDVSAEVGQLIGDLACRMILGCSTRDKFNLKPVIHEALNLAGAFNLADYVPLLGALDLQGITRRAKAVNRAVDEVLEDIISEHEEDTTENTRATSRHVAGMGHQ
ncbi:cytochrome P450 CYP736A12 [Eucalyptus grandis]|uniref:cytochrome P450 CYP736A12 n=1 Tax=Eucalyptus grandis TaxID=71139 RepID=UPI00192EF352|nr:cytochrome P450 CYP736A12 [Eucalyptus grandis]